MVVITSVGECVIPYPHRRTNKTRITLPPNLRRALVYTKSQIGVYQRKN